MKTDFWASGNQFFSIFLDSSQLLTLEVALHLTRTYWKRGNEVFIRFLSIVLFRVFSCKWKLLLKLGGNQFFKNEPYSCQWKPIFSIFQRFFKLEATFPYSGNVFFNIFYPASANRFSAQWKQYCLVSAILLLQEPLLE